MICRYYSGFRSVLWECIQHIQNIYLDIEYNIYQVSVEFKLCDWLFITELHPGSRLLSCRFRVHRLLVPFFDFLIKEPDIFQHILCSCCALMTQPGECRVEPRSAATVRLFNSENEPDFIRQD